MAFDEDCPMVFDEDCPMMFDEDCPMVFNEDCPLVFDEENTVLSVLPPAVENSNTLANITRCLTG